MKYILLIMTMIQIKTFWGSFKGIFQSSKGDVEKLNSSMGEFEEVCKNKEVANVFMMIFSVLYGLFLTLYYILAGIKVGSLIYAIMSCLMVLVSWKNVGKTIQWLDSRSDELVKRRFKDRIWSVFYLSYIGYLIYFLVVNW